MWGEIAGCKRDFGKSEWMTNFTGGGGYVDFSTGLRVELDSLIVRVGKVIFGKVGEAAGGYFVNLKTVFVSLK